MTTRDERSRALVGADDFLRALVSGQEFKNVPEEVRERALRILRHFPSVAELHSLAENEERAPQDVLRPLMLSTREFEFALEQRRAAYANLAADVILQFTKEN